MVRKAEWRKNVATMKTRGFWIVNVIWFAAGGIFFQLLPQRKPTTWLNGSLNDLLFILIVLPFYFSAVLTWSSELDKFIDKWIQRKNGKHP